MQTQKKAPAATEGKGEDTNLHQRYTAVGNDVNEGGGTC